MLYLALQGLNATNIQNIVHQVLRKDQGGTPWNTSESIVVPSMNIVLEGTFAEKEITLVVWHVKLNPMYGLPSMH